MRLIALLGGMFLVIWWLITTFWWLLLAVLGLGLLHDRLPWNKSTPPTKE